MILCYYLYFHLFFIYLLWFMQITTYEESYSRNHVRVQRVYKGIGHKKTIQKKVNIGTIQVPSYTSVLVYILYEFPGI